MFPNSRENEGRPTTMQRIRDWNLRSCRNAEAQMLGGGQGKNAALRPVRRQGESEGRNGEAGREGKKGKRGRKTAQWELMPAGKNVEKRGQEGPGGGRNPERCGIPPEP